MAKLYDLTPYTGRKRGQHRRTVVLTVETTNRQLLLIGIGVVAGMLFAGMLFPIVGVWSLAVFVVTIPAVQVLASTRRTGLQVSVFRAMNDRLGVTRGWKLGVGGVRRTHRHGQIIMAGRPIPAPHLRLLVPVVVECDLGGGGVVVGSGVSRRGGAGVRFGLVGGGS